MADSQERQHGNLKMTDETIQKLEQGLQNGFTISKACQLSGISTSLYYDYLKQDDDFSVRMTLAKEWATERARQVLVTSIQEGDVATAKWWLERKVSDEFGNKAKLEGVIKTENTYNAHSPEELLAMRQRMAEMMGLPVQEPSGEIEETESLTVSDEIPDDIQKDTES